MDSRHRGDSIRRMQSVTSTADYRDDDVIPPELYDTRSSRYSESSLFRRAPDGRERTSFPWRTVLVAIFLFVLGLTFLLTGLLHFWDRERGVSIAFVSIGCLAFLPGAYITFNLIQVARGVPGFHLSEFAHWDDYRW